MLLVIKSKFEKDYLIETSIEKNLYFFKSVIIKSPNFAIQYFKSSISNKTFDQKHTLKLNHQNHGDLLTKLILMIKLPDLPNNYSYINKLGHHLINEYEIEINGKIIDKRNGEWLEIKSQIENNLNYKKMIGDDENYFYDNSNKIIYIPLDFWFTQDYNSALPLISLNKSDININLRFNNIKDIILSTNEEYPNINLTTFLIMEEIFLDLNEREYFIKNEHKYLLNQLQYFSKSINQKNILIPIDFHSPIKQIFWTFPNYQKIKNNFNKIIYHQKFNYLDPNPITTLIINNKEILPELPSSFFNLVIPYLKNQHSNNINTYSFQINNFGSIDLSKIEKNFLKLSNLSNVNQINLFAINYHLITIKDGLFN